MLSADFKAAIVREMQCIADEKGNPNVALTKSEFVRMFVDHGMAEDLSNGLYDMCDTDKDGEATVSEVLTMLTNCAPLPARRSPSDARDAPE